MGATHGAYGAHMTNLVSWSPKLRRVRSKTGTSRTRHRKFAHETAYSKSTAFPSAPKQFSRQCPPAASLDLPSYVQRDREILTNNRRCMHRVLMLTTPSICVAARVASKKKGATDFAHAPAAA